MPSPSEEQLNSLWLKFAITTDPAEMELLLREFRDALHEYINQRKARRAENVLA